MDCSADYCYLIERRLEWFRQRPRRNFTIPPHATGSANSAKRALIDA
jgi:hypothetical protein